MDIKNRFERTENEKDSNEVQHRIEIYAELTKKQFERVASGEYSREVPHGVTMKHSSGSRALRFSCDDIENAKLLMDGLDDSGINWQEM